MFSSEQSPKWLTADRKSLLVKLWEQYGNQCLYGHTACPIPAHYLYIEPKGVKIAIPVKMPCRDTEGNPLKDKNGNQLYLTVYGTKTVTIDEPKLARLYELKSEAVIKDWIADDRAAIEALWKAESLDIHRLGERRYPVRGRFSNISKDIYYPDQPQFYIIGLSMSGLTLKPFAQVRLSSSYIHLFVSLGDTLKPLSKNKRRKAIRYSKALPKDIEDSVDTIIRQAVRHYLDH